MLAVSAPFLACGGSAASSSSPPPDGGSDAVTTAQRPAPSDTEPPTWCNDAGTHDFCADFDKSDFLADWDSAIRGTDRANVDENGVVPSDRSSPNAFRLAGKALPSPDGGADPGGPFSGMFVTKAFTKTASSVHLAFDLDFENDDSFVSVVELDGRTKEHDIAFHVSLGVSKTVSTLPSAVGAIAQLPPMAMNRWVHVDIELHDQTSGDGIASLSYDGVVIGTGRLEGKIASSAETKLYLGISRTAPSGAYDVRYDNVTLDLL